MTEKEARTKKCCGPKVLISPMFAAAGRATSDLTGPLHCNASDCMAWRWVTRIAGDDNGFCGLAGVP